MKLLDDALSSRSAFRGDHQRWKCPTKEVSASRPSRRTAARRKFVVVGLFAGVGGLEEGFRQAGHESSLLCESDPLARHVLRNHFPNVTIATDITTLKSLPACDVLTAGFPCQDLSQVGRRQGIAGPNSGLIESVFQLLRRRRNNLPRWVVLENVP